jgi:hypothetical protein
MTRPERLHDTLSAILIVAFVAGSILVIAYNILWPTEPPATFKERFGIWSSVNHHLPRAPLMRWGLSKII